MKNTNEQVPINYTSSGQQEVLWLYNELYALMLKDEKAFVIIEEPEAHIYPISSEEYIRFYYFLFQFNRRICYCYNTQSVYTDRMQYLCLCRKVKKETGLEMGLKSSRKIGITDVDVTNASKLKQTMKGTEIISLIDEETGELMAEKIDEISKEINQVYTGLFYLEEGL